MHVEYWGTNFRPSSKISIIMLRKGGLFYVENDSRKTSAADNCGSVYGIGIGSKCVVDATLRKLVYGAGNMNKSTHPFIRLVRAKFEHACMISEKVENVGVFVDKYLYEYGCWGYVYIRFGEWSGYRQFYVFAAE